MTSQELNTYVNDLALENPVIDIVEPAAGDDQKESIEQQQWLNSFNEENYYLYQRQNNDDDYDFKDTWNINTDEGETLADYLWSQLITENFSELKTEIIHFCLDSLDNRGYLTETPEDIAAYFKTDIVTIDHILDKLKSLDPSGVCAFNLEECLKLQLKRKKMLTPVMESLIDNHLDMVAKNQIPAIARTLHLSSGEAAGYCQIIKSLNPKPGVSFSSRDQLRYIIPDVTIVKFKDHFDILLNESMYPGIEVNSYYRQMNQAPDSQELKEYLDQEFRGDPFKRAVIWYPTAKNAKDNLVDTLLSFCDCGRLNVYENVPCPMEVPVDKDVYDAIFFTCASSAERMLGSLKPQERETLASVTDIYSIGPKCSAALGELGVSPVIEAAVNTYEGLVNCVLRKE